MSQQNEILLQSGTNEIEIFEFSINSQRFGLNALKIRHVVQFEPDKVIPLPMMPEGMLGTIVDRGEVIKVVDLRKALKIGSTGTSKRAIMILSEFNRQVLGFVVDEILGIQRVGWEQVQSPSSILKTTSITGIAIIGDREISMLDVESIVLTIFGVTDNIDHERPLPFPADFKILVADDSPMIRKKIKWLLEKIEARDVEMFENGAMLYKRFLELHSNGQKIGLVLSDLEMPQVDGFACCKKIKAIDKTVPVVIFSSLINDQITRKCQEVGADLAVNKEEFSRLSQIIKGFLVPAATKAAG
jgi:two-component system, chemotaxis family, chemotaxis protein CheV